MRHKGDSDEHVRDIIVAESVIGCLEVGSEASRRWTLRNLVEVGLSACPALLVADDMTRLGVLDVI